MYSHDARGGRTRDTRSAEHGALHWICFTLLGSLARLVFGFIARGDLVWRDPDRFLNWRASGSFTRLGGGMGPTGDRLPPAQIYGLSASATLSPPGNFVRAGKLAHMLYLAAGPGLYGYRSYTEYRLGWHLAVGLQMPVGQWSLFGEATRTSLGTSASSTGLPDGHIRSLSIGIRR